MLIQLTAWCHTQQYAATTSHVFNLPSSSTKFWKFSFTEVFKFCYSETFKNCQIKQYLSARSVFFLEVNILIFYWNINSYKWTFSFVRKNWKACQNSATITATNAYLSEAYVAIAADSIRKKESLGPPLSFGTQFLGMLSSSFEVTSHQKNLTRCCPHSLQEKSLLLLPGNVVQLISFMCC